MELLLNTANPLAIIIFTLVAVGIIFASKNFKKEFLLVILMAVLICLLVYHSIYLESLNSVETELISQAYHCLAVDLVLLLISFISFLWVDDIVAKNGKIKSYDDSLSWFWNKL